MDFFLTESQKLFQGMVRDFATREIDPVAAAIDEKDEFPSEVVRKLAELGLTGVTIPEQYRGSGGDSIHLSIACEEIARASAAVATIYLASLSLCCHCIYDFATEDQKKKFVVPLAEGTMVGAFGLTEPGAGSDAGALATTATRKGRGYVLSGNKVFISNGREAGIVVIFATIDRALKSKGVTAFIVEKGTPGFSVGRTEHKLGIRGSSTAELILEDCCVPEENRLGQEGRGLRIAMETIDASRISVAMQAVGIARAAFEASLKYAQTREQFGQPIAQHQAIQFMLSDMATSIEAARLLCYEAAFLKDQGQPYAKIACMAKLFASETAMSVTTKAIQVHGGYGYTASYPVERYFRDAKITEIYEGTSEMQRWTIARNLLMA